MQSKLPYVLVMAHRKGGTGKSTIACNILAEFSKKVKTTLIDADSQQHTFKFNSKRKNPAPVANIKNVKELVEFLQQDDGLTIIDLGGYDSEFARAVLAYSDMVITPLSDSEFELDGLVDFTSVLNNVITKSKREDIKPFILTNSVHFNDKSTQKAFKTYAKNNMYEVFDTVIANRKIYKNILSKGKSVSEIEPFGKAAKEIDSLIDEIIEKA